MAPKDMPYPKKKLRGFRRPAFTAVLPLPSPTVDPLIDRCAVPSTLTVTPTPVFPVLFAGVCTPLVLGPKGQLQVTVAPAAGVWAEQPLTFCARAAGLAAPRTTNTARRPLARRGRSLQPRRTGIICTASLSALTCPAALCTGPTGMFASVDVQGNAHHPLRTRRDQPCAGTPPISQTFLTLVFNSVPWRQKDRVRIPSDSTERPGTGKQGCTCGGMR